MDVCLIQVPYRTGRASRFGRWSGEMRARIGGQRPVRRSGVDDKLLEPASEKMVQAMLEPKTGSVKDRDAKQQQDYRNARPNSYWIPNPRTLLRLLSDWTVGRSIYLIKSRCVKRRVGLTA